MRIVLLALLMVALAAPAASAQVEPFPGQTWLVPGQSFLWRASSWPVALPSEMFDFTIYLDEYDAPPEALEIEVSGVPDADPDGTLADATVIDRYEARPIAGHRVILTARTRTDARWLATPGTYYWQASYEEDENGEEELYASPIRSLTIFPAPPPDPPQARSVPPPVETVVPSPPASGQPPLAARTARIVVRRAILAATHRGHKRLAYRCTTAPAAATCRPSWRDARYRYAGTIHIATAAHGITATFSGTRVERSCERRCARHVRWTATL
jgi:hypothetical protein